MGVANDSQLGSKERINGKMEKIKQFAREAKQQPADDRAEVQSLSDAVHRELLQQVEELHQEVQNVKEKAQVCLTNKYSSFEYSYMYCQC